MDFDHRKRVYMTGFMHCNQRVKQGIWIDRMIIGLILYSCFFLLLDASCCVGHGIDLLIPVHCSVEELSDSLLTFVLHRVRCQAL